MDEKLESRDRFDEMAAGIWSWLDDTTIKTRQESKEFIAESLRSVAQESAEEVRALKELLNARKAVAGVDFMTTLAGWIERATKAESEAAKLRAVVEDYRAGAKAEADAGDEARAENEKLRAVVEAAIRVDVNGGGWSDLQKALSALTPKTTEKENLK